MLDICFSRENVVLLRGKIHFDAHCRRDTEEIAWLCLNFVRYNLCATALKTKSSFPLVQHLKV